MDENTFLLKNFIYDGNGPDTYFCAGSSNRAGPQWFIVPNEKGRTNVLQAYLNKEFTLKLNGKKINDIKWLSVYDLTIQVSWKKSDLLLRNFIELQFIFRKTLVIFPFQKDLNLQHLRSLQNFPEELTGFHHLW